MGQAASKANEAAKRAAPRVSQAIQASRTRAAAEAEWKRSSAAAESSASSRDGQYSPTRGQRHQAETAAAIAAAASSRYDSDGGRGSGGGVDVMPEMPPDLIKFLNDAGPLQRTVDKELTSPKVYDTLMKDENARDEQAKQANLRVRRKMPIMSSYQNEGGDGDNDGTMTERTTNFSTKKRSTARTGLGLTREDLFRLSDTVKGMKVDTPEWTKTIDAEYGGLSKKSKKSKNFDQLKNKTIFENSLRYIGVPAIMKDAEGDVIGVWPSKVDDLKFSNGLKLVPESGIRFVMHNEGSVVKES